MTAKRSLLLFLVVPLLFFTYSCGNGAGSGYTPPGKGPGEPIYIKLLPDRYTAQTSGCINLYAEVHDASGELLANIPVTFTNLSDPFGQLVDKCGGTEIAPPVTLNTDDWGRAKVTLYSTTPGFATVIAQTYTGAQPRDTKTFLFSACDSYDCLVLAPSLHLDVNSVPALNDPPIYNEEGDFIIFEPPPDPDDTVELLATVRDAYGTLLPDALISWGSDHTEASYTWTQAYTDQYGQAKGIVEVTPSSLRDTETHVTVWAMATNVGYVIPYDVVTLFLQPVVIDTIAVTADPSVIEPEGTSDITATAWLNTGDLVPDGVSVTFTTCDAALCAPEAHCTLCPLSPPCGVVEPFAQTTSGEATVTFTAPPIPNTCRVTATANSVSGSTDILVTQALTVQPDSLDVNGTVGGIATFTILGGVAPYTVVADTVDPNLQPNPATVANSGDTFTVTVPAGTESGTATYTIRDSIGDEVTATVDISTDALAVLPSTQTLTNPTALDTATYTIFGGVVATSYTAFSSHPSFVSVAVAGSTLTATVNVVPASDTTVTITVVDDLGDTATASLVLDVPAPTPLTVTPISQNTSCSNVAGVNFLITGGGGTPIYTITSLDPNVTITPNATGFNAAPSGCGAFPAASTPVTIVVQDDDTPPNQVTVTLTVTNP